MRKIKLFIINLIFQRQKIDSSITYHVVFRPGEITLCIVYIELNVDGALMTECMLWDSY
jgi:hypothetical protein